MHILYLHQYFIPPDGSGGTRSYEMARRFVAAGHRVTLITSNACFPEHHHLDAGVSRRVIEGIELRILRVPYAQQMSYAERIRAFLRFAAACAQEARTVESPDVIFATSTPLTIAIPAILAKAWHRRPMVFEVRDLWPELPIAIGALRNPLSRAAARALEWSAYRASAHVVALSPGMRDGVVAAGYPRERVSVVPNSCDVELFRPGSDPPAPELPFDPRSGPVITYAGTMGQINGVDYLVRIAAAASRLAPALRFLVAGGGARREFVLNEARAAGVLGRNFWIIPPVPKHTMPGLLARTTVAASLFVDLPAMWNNSANKFFDALAAGKPVMINYGGWQAEILRETGAGIVVPANDPDRAAARVRDLVERPEEIARASSAARRLADTTFNRDRLASELLAILERAAGVTPVATPAARVAS